MVYTTLMPVTFQEPSPLRMFFPWFQKMPTFFSLPLFMLFPTRMSSPFLSFMKRLLILHSSIQLPSSTNDFQPIIFKTEICCILTMGSESRLVRYWNDFIVWGKPVVHCLTPRWLRMWTHTWSRLRRGTFNRQKGRERESFLMMRKRVAQERVSGLWGRTWLILYQGLRRRWLSYIKPRGLVSPGVSFT